METFDYISLGFTALALLAVIGVVLVKDTTIEKLEDKLLS